MRDRSHPRIRFEGAREKLARAREHFEQLQLEGREFLESGAYGVEERENPDEPGARQWVARVNSQPPARLAAILGDVIHNARAALDLGVWDLVVSNGGTPGASTCFPISSSAKEFEARVRHATKGISAEARDGIERLQPYKGGNDRLYRLHRLDIVDKHRLLMTVGAAHRSVGFKLPPLQLPGHEPVEAPRVFLRPADRLFPVQDGDPVAGIAAKVVESGEWVPPTIVFELAFGDEETVRGEPVVETLAGLLSEVDRVLEELGEVAQ